MADVRRDQPPPYTWAADETARARLTEVERRVGTLEDTGREHVKRTDARIDELDKRVDTIEDGERGRKRRFDDLAGIGKALGWLAAVGGGALAWLNYIRR